MNDVNDDLFSSRHVQEEYDIANGGHINAEVVRLLEKRLFVDATALLPDIIDWNLLVKGRSVLVVAISTRAQDVVDRQLYDYKVSVEPDPSIILTPFIIACRTEQYSQAMQLHKLGANVMRKNLKQRYCLLDVLHFKKKENVAFLKYMYTAEPQQNVNHQDVFGNTVLITVSEFLLKADINNDIARYEHLSDIIYMLIDEQGVDVSLRNLENRAAIDFTFKQKSNDLTMKQRSAYNQTFGPLRRIIRFCERKQYLPALEMVNTVYGDTYDPTVLEGITPLRLACADYDNPQAVQLVTRILETGKVPVNQKVNDTSLLEIAIAADNRELVELLIVFSADQMQLNSAGTSPLHQALQGDSFRVVEFLLREPAFLSTDLFIDLNLLSLDMFQLLSKIRGLHPSSKTMELDAMTKVYPTLVNNPQNHLAIIRCSNRSSLDSTMTDGGKILIDAVYNRSTTFVHQLLMYKVYDVNEYDSFGNSALSVAVSLNDIAMAELLQQYGANVQTPIKADVDEYLWMHVLMMEDGKVKRLQNQFVKYGQRVDISYTPLTRTPFSVLSRLCAYNTKAVQFDLFDRLQYIMNINSECMTQRDASDNGQLLALCKYGHQLVIEHIMNNHLSHWLDARQVDSDGCTALFFVASNRAQKRLLEQGVDPFRLNNQREPALLYMIARGKACMVQDMLTTVNHRVFLENNLDVVHSLYLAAVLSNSKSVLFVFADVCGQANIALSPKVWFNIAEFAAETRQASAVFSKLQERSVRDSNFAYKVLLLCVDKNWADGVATCLNTNQFTKPSFLAGNKPILNHALGSAIKYPECVRIQLSKNADPHAKLTNGLTAIEMAQEQNQLDVLALFHVPVNR